jgi:hypothetical protein
MGTTAGDQAVPGLTASSATISQDFASSSSASPGVSAAYRRDGLQKDQDSVRRGLAS